MPSVSSVVKDIINSRPMLYEAILLDIVNYANLAELLHPEIKQETGTSVEIPAIVMALRRYAERMRPVEEKQIPFRFSTEIIMKTGLVDLTVIKTSTLMNKLRRIYTLVDYDKGETLHVIQGNSEVTIVTNAKYKQVLDELLADERVINREKNLVSFSLGFSKDFLYNPGIIAKVTRKLAWDNINILEAISTMTELIFIIDKKDAMRAYSCLQSLIDERNK